MARRETIAAPEPAPTPTIAAPTWALIATAAGTALLLYTAVTTGEWRGAIVSEVQIAVVGLVTWMVLRTD